MFADFITTSMVADDARWFCLWLVIVCEIQAPLYYYLTCGNILMMILHNKQKKKKKGKGSTETYFRQEILDFGKNTRK